MKLTPSEPHFYMYAIKQYQQSNEMYTYETKIPNIFSLDTEWWTLVYFVKYTQSPRSQSVLLSSLYASNDELSMWRQAMEAQFFIHLRKYLFSPAILALKHAMEGAIFWFEKPLIFDSLLQLLNLLCPIKINKHEQCDFIPVLFCWLLEQCNPKATDSDFYQLVNLIDLANDNKTYLNNSCRCHTSCRYSIVYPIYMQNKSNYANIMSCKCYDYLIYDPPQDTRVPIAPIERFTDDRIKELYTTMARKYQSFILITRSAIRTDVNDQLVLMQDRTVSLLFTHPLIPDHLRSNVCVTTHVGSVNDLSVKPLIQQITVIVVVLDISRSMFEKFVSINPNNTKTVFDMSIVMLEIMCDNIVFGKSAHAVGLIHFDTTFDVICPITHIEFGATFEQETAIWLCERDIQSYGIVNKPVYRMPTQMHHKATCKVPVQFAEKIQST
ncbi:hypothetical protein I4U23_004177 [Adineta vaga]|nr:hypothetical protein I4U23_004177 [Adineta vaga]